MGVLIPDPITVEPVAAGDACTICWGSGKPFGDGDTPETITVSFSGINKGPTWTAGNNEPLDGDFVLEQNASFPCLYELTSGIFFMSVEFRSGDTLIFSFDNLLVTHFSGTSEDACGVFVFNVQDSKYTGGSCQIFIPEVE